MPQLGSGLVWSCWDRSQSQDGGGRDGRKKEKEMISREPEEERGGTDWRWTSLQWRGQWRWSQCVVLIALLMLVVLDESPLHPSVSLTEASSRLLLAGPLCVLLALCSSAFHFLLRYRQDVQPNLLCNGDVIERKTAANQQVSVNPQSSSHLQSQVSVVVDCLVVSLLHEPLPDASESHIRGLLTRLEEVSRTLHRGKYGEQKEKTGIQDRVNDVRAYLQDRVSCLRSLLRAQRECDSSVCDLQSSLQKRWTLLEELHTRVTLRPDSTQEVHDPRTVLADAENLFAELGQFKSKVQQCRTQLENYINLLKALRSSHQNLNKTVGTSIESTWTKELLQSNTDLFSEIHEDFSSLEQQTSNFVIHLRGLKACEEEKRRSSEDVRSQTGPSLSLPSVPVYVAVPEAVHQHSDPDSDPESPEPSQKSHSRMSPFHMLCGRNRRRSSP